MFVLKLLCNVVCYDIVWLIWYSIGSISSVSVVDDRILLIMIVVSGCCILVLVLVVNVIGRKLSDVISVVISMGCSCVSVLLCIVVLSGIFLLCRLWMNEIIMRLLSMVMLDSVMKLIVVVIDSGILCSYSDMMLLFSVNGMLVNISSLFFMLLNIMNSSMNIMNSVSGMMSFRCLFVFCNCLNWLFYDI